MPTDQPEGFTDNWAYLKAELRWLDQVLMLAVARQRKDTKEVERIAQSKADRATSPWWKGIITTEGKAAYDEHRQSSGSGDPAKVNYQQQLEQKIQATVQTGITLALPTLRDRLSLTLFEKNLVLMSLAPEVNRRYARLYRFLQGDDSSPQSDLPTLDLALRLLCRNDNEWRSARHRLVSASPLIGHELLHLPAQATDSLLNRPLKLADSLVNYLLAEQPTGRALDALLQSSLPVSSPAIVPKRTVPAVAWSDLVLPDALLTSLQCLSQQIQGYARAEAKWNFQPASSLISPGVVALLVGESGTGKTMAAGAIARSLQTSLDTVDLALVDPQNYEPLWLELASKPSTVLLIKSAHLWFGRAATVPSVALRQFLNQRRQIAGITLFTAPRISSIQASWRQQCDRVLIFPKPNRNDRLRLWQQAVPPEVPVDFDIDWDTLAQLPLTGREIAQIAQTAVLYAAADDASHLEMQHLVTALAQDGKKLKGRSSQPASQPKLPIAHLADPTDGSGSTARLLPASTGAAVTTIDPGTDQPLVRKKSRSTKPRKPKQAS
ncbi:MAG: hypothetical protein Kow00121_53400 [Elainellaceae cyanobacterium]